MPSPRRTLVPVALAVLACLVAQGDLPRRGGPAGEARADERPAAAGALPRFLEAMQVGTASEFRLLVLHPLLVVPPEPASDGAEPAATLPPEFLGLPTTSRDQRDSVRVSNLGSRAAWVLPGDVWRLADGDFVAERDVVVGPHGAADVPVVRAAAAPAREEPREEPRFLGTLPGPALLYTLLLAPREAQFGRACSDLAKEAGLATARKSPAELAQGPVIAARVEEYRRRFEKLTRPAGAGRREVAGVAVVLDGGFAGIEVWSDPQQFAATWARRVEGIAVEAAILETENGLLGEAMPAPGDPDRFTRQVKDAILAVYGLEPKAEPLPGLGVVLPLRRPPDVGRAVADASGAVRHVLWLRDPVERRPTVTKEETEPLAPGPISRKLRPTEFEKRWLERRKNLLDGR